MERRPRRLDTERRLQTDSPRRDRVCENGEVPRAIRSDTGGAQLWLSPLHTATGSTTERIFRSLSSWFSDSRARLVPEVVDAPPFA
jgi:hypothetical protein